MRFTEDFMPKLMADQDQAQKLLALVKNYMSKTGDDFAVAYGFTSEGMQMDMVQRFNGTLEDVRAYYEGMAAQQKAGAFSQLMTGMPGGEAEYIFKRDVRKSNGIPVDLFTMKYKPGNEQSDSPLAQQQLEAIKKIFGSAGFTTEVALLGDTLVMVGGGKDRSARLDRIVKASASLSAPPPKEPIQFSVDLARFLAWAAEIAGSAPPAELKKDLEPLHGTVAFEGRSAVCDVSLPLETISKLAKGIEKLEGQPPQLVPPGGQSQEF